MRSFSIMYNAYHQRKFEEALDSGELEKAVEIIEHLPPGKSPGEWSQRTIVLVEGYRAILDNVLERYDEELNKDLRSYCELGSIEELVESLEELRVYSELGDVEDLKEMKEKVEELLEMWELEEVKYLEGELLELEKYREVGGVEELRELKDSSRSLESL